MTNIESARKAILKKSKQATKTTINIYEIIDMIMGMGPEDCKLVQGTLNYKDSCFRQQAQGACTTTSTPYYQQVTPNHAFSPGDPDPYDPTSNPFF